MSRYMWRESRCTPNVRSRTRDSGLLQINDVNLPWLSSKLHRRITPTALMDPTTNVQAAARLCEYGRRAWGNCYQPWQTN
jgi:soluble lytic murein transglycosylase-like protein